MTPKKSQINKKPSAIIPFSIVWTQVGRKICIATHGASAAIFDSNALAAAYFREVADSLERRTAGKAEGHK
jgi:hypothetical protein